MGKKDLEIKPCRSPKPQTKITNIDKGTCTTEITMQEVQDAVNVLCGYATKLEEYLAEQENTCFSDKVRTANHINDIWAIDKEWDGDVESGRAYFVFGFSDKDIDEYVKSVLGDVNEKK